MIERIDDLPGDVLGFRAHGPVTDEDYESVIRPAMDQALLEGEKIRLLCHLPNDMDGAPARAPWEDARIRVDHVTAWDRIALVTDDGRLRKATAALGFLMPDVVRVYPNESFDEARDWVSD